MSVLSLIQQRSKIRSELSRRVGYTNGLHGIFRFARVVTYLHELGPAPTASLRNIILSREEGVSGRKYADGVIDVARALGLVCKSGTSLTPSDKGYALFAAQRIDQSEKTAAALLLHSVLEFDGDATLNLLDILSTTGSSESQGNLLIQRLLRVLDIRARWTRDNVQSKSVREMLLQELSGLQVRLAMAADIDRRRVHTWSAYREAWQLSAQERLKRFHAHTMNPRRGWLKELGCIREENRHRYRLTKAGQRLLTFFKDQACHVDSTFVLPFSFEVSEILSVPTPESRKDLFWRATASSFGDSVVPEQLSTEQQLGLIEEVYPHVKFQLFNEAAIDSVYASLAARSATEARYIKRERFNRLLETAIQRYPNKVYKLRERHGASGYITVRSAIR